MNLLEHLENADLVMVDGELYRPDEFWSDPNALPQNIHDIRVPQVCFYARNQMGDRILTRNGIDNAIWVQEKDLWMTSCGAITTYKCSTKGLQS